MRLKFRPHHFLCSLSYEGKGYSPDFIKNFDSIIEKLRAFDGNEVEIEVILETDDICAPCPSKRGKLCASQQKIEKIDKGHQTALRIKEKDVLTWGEAQKRIQENVTLEIFKKICAPCQWQPLGICEKALLKLRTKK